MNVYENVDECNPSRKRKILIVFDNMSFHFFFFPGWGYRRREDCIFMGKERVRFEVVH